MFACVIKWYVHCECNISGIIFKGHTTKIIFYFVPLDKMYANILFGISKKNLWSKGSIRNRFSLLWVPTNDDNSIFDENFWGFLIRVLLFRPNLLIDSSKIISSILNDSCRNFDVKFPKLRLETTSSTNLQNLLSPQLIIYQKIGYFIIKWQGFSPFCHASI